MTFQTKLGTTRAGERSRIWLEGARLTAAGFKPGMQFLKAWGAGSLVLATCTSKQFEAAGRDERGTVSGKDAKPIIDITGAHVRDTFGAGSHVSVTYAHRTITITTNA